MSYEITRLGGRDRTDRPAIFVIWGYSCQILTVERSTKTAGSGCGFPAISGRPLVTRLSASLERVRLVRSFDRLLESTGFFKLELSLRALCQVLLNLTAILRINMTGFAQYTSTVMSNYGSIRISVTSANLVYGIIHTLSHDCQVIYHTSVAIGNSSKCLEELRPLERNIVQRCLQRNRYSCRQDRALVSLSTPSASWNLFIGSAFLFIGRTGYTRPVGALHCTGGSLRQANFYIITPTTFQTWKLFIFAILKADGWYLIVSQTSSAVKKLLYVVRWGAGLWDYSIAMPNLIL